MNLHKVLAIKSFRITQAVPSSFLIGGENRLAPASMPTVPEGLEGLMAREGLLEVQGSASKQRSAAFMPLRCARFEGFLRKRTRWVGGR